MRHLIVHQNTRARRHQKIVSHCEVACGDRGNLIIMRSLRRSAPRDDSWLMRRCASALVLWCSGVLVLFSTQSIQAELQVHVLDVGYGAAVHVEDELDHYFFDIGPEAAQQTILNHLADHGVTRLRAVFLTHTHPDHAGSLLAILGQIKTDVIFWNDRLPPNEKLVQMLDQAQEIAPFQPVKSGQTLSLSRDFRVRILNSNYETMDLNDGGLVFALEYKKKKLLLPGDIGSLRQKNLVELNKKWLEKVNWMLWPHHGDRLDESFLAVFKKPLIGVVSVAENPYKVPHGDIKSQAKLICSELYRTDTHGPLHFSVNYKITLITDSIANRFDE